MKHLFLFMVMLVAFAISSTAQNQRMIFKVMDGADLNTVLLDSRFLFDSYKKSQVFFTDTTTTNALMNYNLLFDEMLFIDPNGDTLILSNISDVAAIVIDRRLFKYNSQRFLEVIAFDKETKIELLAKRHIQYDSHTYGPYGMASPTTLSVSVSERKVAPIGKYDFLGVNKEVRFQRKDVYYLAQGEKNRVANKKGFLKVFSKHSNAVKSYIKKEKIKFNKEQDILRLYEYCVNVQAQSKR